MPTEIDRILGRIANILRQDKEMLLMAMAIWNRK